MPMDLSLIFLRKDMPAEFERRLEWSRILLILQIKIMCDVNTGCDGVDTYLPKKQIQ